MISKKLQDTKATRKKTQGSPVAFRKFLSRASFFISQFLLNLLIGLIFSFSNGNTSSTVIVTSFLVAHFLIQVLIQLVLEKLLSKVSTRSLKAYHYGISCYWILSSSSISIVFLFLAIQDEKKGLMEANMERVFPIGILLVQFLLNRMHSRVTGGFLLEILEGLLSFSLFLMQLFLDLPADFPKGNLAILVLLQFLLCLTVILFLKGDQQNPNTKGETLSLIGEKKSMFETQGDPYQTSFIEELNIPSAHEIFRLADMESQDPNRKASNNEAPLDDGMVTHSEKVRQYTITHERFFSEFPNGEDEEYQSDEKVKEEPIQAEKEALVETIGPPLVVGIPPLIEMVVPTDLVLSKSSSMRVSGNDYINSSQEKGSTNKNLSVLEKSNDAKKMKNRIGSEFEMRYKRPKLLGEQKKVSSGDDINLLHFKSAEVRTNQRSKTPVIKGHHTKTSDNLINHQEIGNNESQEIQLEKKKEKIRIVKVLLEAMPDGIAIATSSLEFNFMNKSMYTIFKITFKSAIKNRLLNLVCETDQSMKNFEFMQIGTRMGSLDEKSQKEKEEMKSNSGNSSELFGMRHNSLEFKNQGNTLKDKMIQILEYFDERTTPKHNQNHRSITSKGSSQGGSKKQLKLRSFKFRSTFIESSSNQTILLEIQLTPMIYSREPMIGIMVRDVTQEKTIARLSAEVESKTKVLANVSHELRTPLHGIMSFLTMAKEHLNEEEAKIKMTIDRIARDFIEPAILNTRRLTYLVGSYLDLSQLRAGKKDILNMTVFPLKECLRDCLKLVDLQAKEKNIELYLRYDSTLPLKITSDKNRLSQIVINLLGNAMKFTYKGSVTIVASISPGKTPNCIRISVKDTGRGIKDEDKKKLFQEFGKVDYGDNAHGIGLGLMISNHLVMLLGKSNQGLRFKSEWNVGTEFFFEIRNNNLHSEVQSNEENIMDQSENDSEFDATPAKFMKILSKNSGGPQKLLTDLSGNNGNMDRVNSFAIGFDSKKCKNCPKVLYVDDDAVNIMAFRFQANKMDFLFETACSKTEGIKKLKERRKARCHVCSSASFSVIFMDVELDSGQSGLEFASEIKAGAYSEGVPQESKFVVCSGHSKEELKEKEGFDCADDFLEKPFTFEDFREVLKKFSLNELKEKADK